MVKALLIHRPDRFEAEEAVALAEAGGYEVVGSVTQRYLSHAKYGVGSGKAEEVARAVREKEAKMVLFDAHLNASQAYNLAKLCEVEVKDREKLILEIFALRASTAEAKLQIELAELSYELPRAREKVRRAKLGEQPGFFGLGKFQVDVYVKMLKRQKVTIQKKIAEVRERREIFRYRRERQGYATVAITGYTGAGKTTLFNRLAGERKAVDAGVFTTLSLTTRGVDFGGRKVLVSDTVGFISRLPTFLIEAFKSTLEEVTFSSLVMLLLDGSLPDDLFQLNGRSCYDTLSELGVPDSRVLVVVNKCDLVTEEELDAKLGASGLSDVVRISAKKGTGMSALMDAISARLPEEGLTLQ